MDLSMSAVYSAMSAAQEALTANAQDMANVSTPGYRPQQTYFESATTAFMPEADGQAQSVPWSVQLNPGAPSAQPGPLQSSPSPLHVALSAPDDYFSVQTPQGTAYTRDGDFHLDGQGNLLDARGDAVLGDSGPLQAPNGQAVINPDGSFAAMNSDGTFGSENGGGQTLLVTNLKGLSLQRQGGQLFTLASGQQGGPAQGGVLPGQLEGSGADTFKGMSDLVMLMRWSESLQKAAQASDSAEGSILQAARLND